MPACSLPGEFRVAAAAADGAKAVEAVYIRPFVSHLIYAWEANTVREATPPLLRFFVRLASTLIPSLIIEGLIFTPGAGHLGHRGGCFCVPDSRA